MRPSLCSNAIHKKTVNSDKSEVAAITSAAKGPSPPICSAIGNEDTAVGTQKMAKRETKAVPSIPSAIQTAAIPAGTAISLIKHTIARSLTLLLRDEKLSPAPRRISDKGEFIDERTEIGVIIAFGIANPNAELKTDATPPAIAPMISGFRNILFIRGQTDTFLSLIVSNKTTAKILYSGTTIETHIEARAASSAPQIASTTGIAKSMELPLYPP